MASPTHGHEFWQTLGDDEGQGSLACCSPWGHKESNMTEQLNNNKGSCDKPLNHFSVLASGFQGKAVNPKSEFYSESDCSLEEGSRLYSGTGSQPHFSRAQGTFKETSQKQKQNKTKKTGKLVGT